MSTFFAAFPDSGKAQQMVRHLLNDGINLDDISLVTRDEVNIEDGGAASNGDASFFVGRTDDPAHDLVDESTPDADYEAAEISRIGGGISTSDSGQNVDSVDQMDDSQSAAEDETWPREDTSNSRHELDDLDRAVRTGFPTPVTPLDNDVATDTEPDRSFDPVPVPGVGVVIGGGDLATAAFDWGGNGKTDSSAFLTYLQDEGVPPGPANELLSQFGNGGAVLAVALFPEVNEDALEDVAERYGAVTSGWFGAPRY
jgi:hypothetical protein